MTLLLLFLAAYLLGSIPTAVWVGKIFYGIDVRQHGSGNAGATNTIRVLGWKAGGPVFLFDILKGWASVMLAHFSSYQSGSDAFINTQLALGVFAVTGHIFPLYAGFKGGKGVATLLGLTIAVTPLIALFAFCVFLVFLFLFKYVSVGSMAGGISYPIMVIFVFDYSSVTLKIFAVIIAVLLLITHHKNIKRLIKGEESKASFLVKKKV